MSLLTLINPKFNDSEHLILLNPAPFPVISTVNRCRIPSQPGSNLQSISVRPYAKSFPITAITGSRAITAIQAPLPPVKIPKNPD